MRCTGVCDVFTWITCTRYQGFSLDYFEYTCIEKNKMSQKGMVTKISLDKIEIGILVKANISAVMAYGRT